MFSSFQYVYVWLYAWTLGYNNDHKQKCFLYFSIKTSEQKKPPDHKISEKRTLTNYFLLGQISCIVPCIIVDYIKLLYFRLIYVINRQK